MTARTRGQTIALFSMSVLLITLMVLMTLSLGAKVRDRMDLQTVADAAAYSNAIATARTMNTMAVMNRAMVAHTVSTIGAVSLISWTTLYYNNARAAARLFAMQLALVAIGVAVWCPIAFACCAALQGCCAPMTARCQACIQSVIIVGISTILMNILRGRLRNKLNADIEVYNGDTLPRFAASAGLFTSAVQMYDGRLRSKIEDTGGSFAASYLTQAKLGPQASVTPDSIVAGKSAAGALNDNELTRASLPNNERAGQQPYHAAQAVMGTRGHPFVPERELDVWDWSMALTLPWSLPNATWAVGGGLGRGYVNTGITSNPSFGPVYGHPGSPSYSGINAHDDGSLVRTLMIPLFLGAVFTANTSSYYTCTIFGPLAIVLGLLGEDAADARVMPTNHPGVHGGLHAYPPATFPSFYDFNPNNLVDGTPTGGSDLNGQPRTVAVVQKTPPTWSQYGGNTNPFDIRVGLPSQAGRRANFDMTGQSQAAFTGGKQLAIGAGVTYYARPDHWDEPPNMFAPYWHATLGRLTIDRPGPGLGLRGAYDAEVTDMLRRTGQTEAATAYDALTAAGYMGLDPR